MSASTQSQEPVLKLRNVVRHYSVRGHSLFAGNTTVHAVNDVSFDVHEGETLGLVGESGCGKSTLARLALGIEPPTQGDVFFNGNNIANLPVADWRLLRQRMQMIFQDPSGALDPRMTVGSQIREPLEIHQLQTPSERDATVKSMIAAVGLSEDLMHRFPHELSGGQQQRVVIARALVLRPALLVCDEPVSALDVSVQAQVVNLLRELQRKLSLTFVFISHDLSIVRHICDRIAVMYLGEIVELTDRDTLFDNPQHPYTQALISAVPIPDPAARRHRILLKGDPPNAINLPTGCRFHTRCPHATAQCRTERPALKPTEAEHVVACHLIETSRALHEPDAVTAPRRTEKILA